MKGSSSPTIFVAVLVVYFVASFALFLRWPAPLQDESQFGDIANTLRTRGVLGTELIVGMEDRVYWQPPVYFLTLVPVIQVFGFSLEALRSFSIFVGACIIVVTYFFAQRVTKDRNLAAGTIVLLALNPNYVNYVKLARMDGLCMLFVLVGVLAYLTAVEEERNFLYPIAGLFLGLAALTHPLGMVAIGAILIHLVWGGKAISSSRGNSLVLIAIPILLLLAFWVRYVLEDPEACVRQIAFQIDRKDREILPTLLRFAERYRAIPLFFIGLLAGMGHVIVQGGDAREKGWRLLGILFVAYLLAVSMKFEVPYHVFVLPFASIAVASFLMSLHRAVSRKLSILAAGSAGLVLLNFVLYFVYLNVVLRSGSAGETTYSSLTDRITTIVPNESTVYLYGFPSMYWGLREKAPGMKLREPIHLLPDSLDRTLLDVNNVVFTRNLSPAEDAIDLDTRLSFLNQIASRRGKTLRLVGVVGAMEKFAYSARVYSVVPEIQADPGKSKQ